MTTPLQSLVSALNSQFPERREAIDAIMAAVVAKQHCVMYGEPGTGKSLLARTVAKSLGQSFFEYLMTRFTEPSEVFGPVDPTEFRQGRYARNTKGKLSECQIAFLDEIFKSNSAILNSLLTILNERTYDAGNGPKAVPLSTMIAASNEMPEGPELAALYDRVLVRLEVHYISDDTAFADMLTSNGIAMPAIQVDIAAEQATASKVQVTSETVQAIIALRNACKKQGIAVSDRRYRECLTLIKAYAHIEGRTETAPDDLEILEHVLWAAPKDKVMVSKTIQSVISPSGAIAVEMLDAARDLIKNLPANPDMPTIGAAVRDIADVSKRLESLPKGRRVDSAKAEVATIKATIAKRAMKAAGVDI